jgi:hypothetical protein
VGDIAIEPLGEQDFWQTEMRLHKVPSVCPAEVGLRPLPRLKFPRCGRLPDRRVSSAEPVADAGWSKCLRSTRRYRRYAADMWKYRDIELPTAPSVLIPLPFAPLRNLLRPGCFGATITVAAFCRIR